jgi:hypothetical protein
VWKSASEYRHRLTGSIGPLLLIGLVALNACQLPWLFNGADPLPGNLDFMDIWQTYRHCNASSEPEEIRGDLHELVRFALVVNSQNQPPDHLPAVIRPWMEALPSTLAVDPNAMAMACAQRGARAAALTERSVVDIEVRNPSGADDEGLSYRWYAIKAEAK